MNKEELIKLVKRKKEFSGLPNELISNFLEFYLKKINFEKISKHDAKIIIKEIRAQLRYSVGQYQTGSKNREKLLEENKITELLKTHSSTAERMDFYPTLKKLIKKLNVKSVLDLGCGLNPIALASNEIKYHASDIREDELFLVRKFFKKNKIVGKVFVCDLKNLQKKLPKADLCLILKVFDIIDDKNHETPEKIVQEVPCEKMLVSFPSKKLSGKQMNHPRRFWFEKILYKLNYNFETFHSDNEIFYLICQDLFFS